MLNPEEMGKRLNRHYRFWGEKFPGEGAYFAVTSPSQAAFLETSQEADLKAGSLKEKWFDADYRIARFNSQIENTLYFGDAVPTANVDFGPGVLAAFLGASYRLDENTVWFDVSPMIRDWEKPPQFYLHKESEIYKAAVEVTRKCCENAAGRYIVSLLDIGVNLDVLSSLRSREELLMDLIDAPEAVQHMLEKLDAFWLEAYSDNYGIIRSSMEAITSWIPIASHKRWYPLLSEFSTMISPSMFEEFSLPALQREADGMDQVLFNLDGEGQIKHLSNILQIQGLHAIEWDPVPVYDVQLQGFKKDFCTKTSLDVFKRIQAAGKKLVINGIRPEQVETVLKSISPDGVFFLLECAGQREAEEFTAFAKPWIRPG